MQLGGSALSASVVVAAGCGGQSADTDSIHQSTTNDSGATGQSAGENGSSTAMVDSADATTGVDVTGGESTPAETSSSAGTSTTGADPPLYELCPTATDQATCESIDPLCRWIAVYDVLSSETCALSEPAWGCWQQEDGQGAQGCFEWFPQACREAMPSVGPVYRVLDGIVQVADVTICQREIIAPPNEPQWTLCPAEEFNTPPPECYCLCMG